MSKPKRKYVEQDEFCVSLLIFDIYDEYDHDSERKWETFEVEGESVTLQRIPKG